MVAGCLAVSCSCVCEFGLFLWLVFALVAGEWCLRLFELLCCCVYFWLLVFVVGVVTFGS